MKRIVLLVLAFFILSATVFADDLVDISNKVKNDFPDIMEKFYSGGATDADMDRFLSGLEKYVKNKGIDITEDNIDDILKEAVTTVLMYSENLPVYNALTQSFTDEAIYFMKNNAIPPSLIPLFEAVKKEILAAQNREITFSDINEFAWAEEAITVLVESEVLSGYPDGTFRGNANITRAEFTKLVVLAFGEFDESLPCDFSDVDPSDWFAPYIASAKKAGMVNGYEDNTFRPQDFITRQDIAVIVYNAAFAGDVNPDPTFWDTVLISDYARPAVGTMQHLSLIKGMGNNLFRPLEHATRAQAAQIIYNALFN